MTSRGGLANSPLATPAGVLLMLALGAIAGTFNCLAVTRFRMPAFMVTLATMMAFGGIAVWLTKTKSINRLPASFNALGGNLALAFAITAACVIFVHLMLSRSLFGRWLYAVGHNARTAHVSGVPVARVLVAAYITSGTLAALAAILYTGQAETGSPVLAPQRILLDVIGGTVIGGTSLFAGVAKPMVNVETFGAWTARFTPPGVFPADVKEACRREVDHVARHDGLYLHFHNSPWLQQSSPGSTTRYDLGGQGTAGAPGIRWYFELVRGARATTRKP